MLTLSGLSKTFHHKTVAQSLSLSVPNGHIVAILGRSGSGKSTLLNMIAGLVQADSGTITLGSRLLNPLPTEQRRVAMMFQDFALFPHLNVWQNVAFSLRLKNVSKTEARLKAEQALKEVNLEGFADHNIAHLSGGEQQRVALARALLMNPEVLLLDEPFSSLDTQLKTQLHQQVKNLIQQKNIPCLLVSHDPDEVCSLANHVALLHQGEIIQFGTPLELLTRPCSVNAIRLLGGINVFDTYYIPPTAITLSSTGEKVSLISVTPLPFAIKIEILHPSFGRLFFFHHHIPTQNEISITINTQQIIYFHS